VSKHHAHTGFCIYCSVNKTGLNLQDQDEVVRRFVALEQEVLRRSLVPLVELELLDHGGVLDQPQQDLL